MDFEHSARALDLRARLQAFMQAEVEPVEHLYQEQVETVARYRRPQVLEELKAKARAAGRGRACGIYSYQATMAAASQISNMRRSPS